MAIIVTKTMGSHLHPTNDLVWVRCSQHGTGPSDNDEDDHNVQSRCGTWWQVHQSSGHRERKQRWLWLKPPLIIDLAVIILVAVHNIIVIIHPCNHRHTDGIQNGPFGTKKNKMAGFTAVSAANEVLRIHIEK